MLLWNTMRQTRRKQFSSVSTSRYYSLSLSRERMPIFLHPMIITSPIWPESPMIPVIIIIHHRIWSITKPWRVSPEWRVIRRISIMIRVSIPVSISISIVRARVRIIVILSIVWHGRIIILIPKIAIGQTTHILIVCRGLVVGSLSLVIHHFSIAQSILVSFSHPCNDTFRVLICD